MATPDEPRAPSPLRTLWVALGLVAATIACYGAVRGHAFLTYDDGEYVLENPEVNRGLTDEGFVWAFTQAHSNNWHPLTWLSHMLDVELFGLDAGRHHVVAAALHALNALLLFLLLQRLTRAFWPSALVAALFCVHPLRVESVAWISERKDLLSCFFLLATVGAYVRYAARPAAGRYALVCLLFTLGLLSKQMLVTLPVLLLLLDRWPLQRLAGSGEAHASANALPQRGRRRLLLEKLPLLVLATGFGVATLVAQRAGGALRELEALPFAARLSNAFVAGATYLSKSLWPVDLAFFYPHPAIVDPGYSPWNTRALGALVLFVALSLVAQRQRRRRPYLFVGWWWTVVALLPVIGLLQVGEQALADRYAYVPLIGLYVALAWGLAELATGSLRTPIVAATCIALVALGLVTRRQVDVWRDSITLYEHALAVTESNYVAQHNLANVYLATGDFARARGHYEETLRILPTFAQAYYNFGLLEQREGHPAAALARYENALKLSPGMVVARQNLGALLFLTGEPERAAEELQRVLAQDPENADSYYNLGGIRASEGRDDEAATLFREALVHRPDHADAHRYLGLLLEARGQAQEALPHLRQGLRQDSPPWDAAARLAWILATSRDDAVRDGATALRWARHATRATSEAEPRTYEPLAAALAETSDFDGAVRWQTRAVESGPPESRAAARTRLESYRRQQPWRE